MKEKIIGIQTAAINSEYNHYVEIYGISSEGNLYYLRKGAFYDGGPSRWELVSKSPEIEEDET